MKAVFPKHLFPPVRSGESSSSSVASGGCFYLRPTSDTTAAAAAFKVLLLRGDAGGGPTRWQLEALVNACPFAPQQFFVYPSGSVALRLLFREWSDALDALVFLWRRRLDGAHLLLPRIDSSGDVSFERLEEEEVRLKSLFLEYGRGLLDCESVRRWRQRAEKVGAEISRVSQLLRRPRRYGAFVQLQSRRDKLKEEKESMEGRLVEFRMAIRCLLAHLGEAGEDEEGGFRLFKLSGVIDWSKIHRIMARECRRLDDGLPIYACRSKILQSIIANQVVVLIGETGSGKSTQLVQFLIDCGLADGSIVCTQPRKIAAMSLAQRVSDESDGCYRDNSVVYYPAYSSSQEFSAEVVYMTDHCLLQHCMSDTGLADISFIIVDEAHERSLNTDLLLAIFKKKLVERFNLRLVIMSATADATKLADYFDGCPTFYVMGRNFPVEIKYVPDMSSEVSSGSMTKQYSEQCASYVSDVVNMVRVIHRSEEDGTILAFLTSQMEVEWACENFNDKSLVVLPFHGKLSYEEQTRALRSYPGKRKVIFSTNVAETSLTIQDVKYVVDSGMVKECRFEPSTGMNMLKVCRISQSSANQRAGRAGRTEPGKCYRLYSENDFKSMQIHLEPEIRKVHLGMAVLRILALGINNIMDFEFVDAPSPKAIETAIQNLVLLGSIICKNKTFELTETGCCLVKLGIEPLLGKIILDCFDCGLKKEGLVLAAVMANASNIFCRVGSDDDKLKADCLKIPFCHRDGDLFTLLSVYKGWEDKHENKSKWCWQHSVNAKSMRRCHDTILELEKSLRHELKLTIPSYWLWNPQKPSVHDKSLKKVILSSLAGNVAMYSGYDRLGYEVASTGQYLQLHPSCSLLTYGQKPNWVVFGEILSSSRQYLVCVTAIDYECLYRVQPPLYDVLQLECRKLQMDVITGVQNLPLRRFCGKLNHNLKFTVSRIQKVCRDNRIGVDVDFGKGEVLLFASAKDMETVSSIVNDALEHETRWLRNECVEKYIYQGGSDSSFSVALFGSGAEIKHLELEKRSLTVEIFHPKAHNLDDKELLITVDKYAPDIVNFYKHTWTVTEKGGADETKWGKVTFLSPESAENAVAKLNGLEFHGHLLKALQVKAGDKRCLPFPTVRSKVCWPRRASKGSALILCRSEDTDFIVKDCSTLVIAGGPVHFDVSTIHKNRVFVKGLPRDISEDELYDALSSLTKRRITGVHILRGEAIDTLPSTCAKALCGELGYFMASNKFPRNSFRVEVFDPEPNDIMMRAVIIFDGRLHLEAALALDHIKGKVLPGCLPWQKIECKHIFQSSLFCSDRVYSVIKKQLNHLLESFKHKKGVTCQLEKNGDRYYRVKITANATMVVADLRRPFEQLMQGQTVIHPSLSPMMMQVLSSRDGITLLKGVERDTGTYIMYDRRNMNLKVFGSHKGVTLAKEKLVEALLSMHEGKQLLIHLRGRNLPPDLMKEVVRRFGPDLQTLKDKVPGVELSLKTRCHQICVRGGKKLKDKVEEIISEVADTLDYAGAIERQSEESSCPICLCELEEPYKLEDCGHYSCRACLIEQCDVAIRSRDGFPLCCSKEGCGWPLLLVDLRSLLSSEKVEELFRSSLVSFVGSSSGAYRFCPSPDCPLIYRVSPPDASIGLFRCEACGAETCTKCHLEYHPFISCDMYRKFKDDPDLSLEEWRKGKEEVKDCPSCSLTIEKNAGCNHIACRCGKHICWVCLSSYPSSQECYEHLNSVHQTIYI